MVIITTLKNFPGEGTVYEEISAIHLGRNRWIRSLDRIKEISERVESGVDGSKEKASDV